jgi:CHRD domain
MGSALSRRAAIAMTALAFVLAASTGTALAKSESFTVALTGATQVPPVETAGKGTAALTYDPATREVTWSVTYSGLSGPATMAHFHGPAAAGKNGPVIIWLTKKGETAPDPFKGEATLSPEQAQQFAAGEWYINVHTQKHPGGEIRGQVMPPKM